MRGLDERVKNAVSIDPSIVSSREAINDARGRTEEEMDRLGLTRRDLKWLERKGLAVRAYTSNGGILYTDSEGKRLPRPMRKFGPGRRVKWIILTPKDI